MKKSNKRDAIVWGILSLLMLLFIYGQSLLPPQESGDLSYQIMAGTFPFWNPLRWFSIDVLHILIRKLAHLGEYFLFCVFLTNFLRTIDKRKVFLSVIMSVAVACSDEFIQLFNGRNCNLGDVILDSVGALFGYFFVLFLYRLSRKKENENEA